ncbi:MAG: hypothetical protein IPK75_18790 [Acidobacteria bacterium]|nr:hypothetical protein [Acidobacteriota bacterium]
MTVMEAVRRAREKSLSTIAEGKPRQVYVVFRDQTRGTVLVGVFYLPRRPSRLSRLWRLRPASPARRFLRGAGARSLYLQLIASEDRFKQRRPVIYAIAWLACVLLCVSLLALGTYLAPSS